VATMIRCENCGGLTWTQRAGYYWCDNNCKDAVHRRLLGTADRETRYAAPLQGASVAKAWETLAAEAKTTFDQAVKANRR
jgi:hypothetical protein